MTEETSSVPDRLTREIAALAKNIVELPGDASGTLEAELEYIRTVHKHLREPLDAVQQGLVSLVSEITESPDTKDLDLAVDYYPHVTDKLDAMLEIIDTSLDVVYGKRPAEAIKVSKGQGKKRRFLDLERDPLKILSVRGQEIFVPTKHPFEDEVRSLYLSESDLPPAGEEFPLEPDMDKFPFEWIDTPEALTRASIDLERERCIAVDLENHSFHSYYGFLCLMQISTSSCDYVIDVIRLREHVGAALRGLFSAPDIIKVFHGAQSDIQWLQRDFNIFIVNMFDTFFAAKALQLPAFSLSHLLLRYAAVTADKKYQLADWRTRPVPADMLNYARMDTHYLLHIYGRLRDELLERGGAASVLSVFQQSTRSALALYRPEASDPQGWRSIVGKSTIPYSEREVSLVKAIYAWRERIAKQENESPPAVMPNYMILRLAQGSSTDPEVILKSAKHPMVTALKAIDSLKEAMLHPHRDGLEDGTVIPEKAASPTPIIKDGTPDEKKRAMEATQDADAAAAVEAIRVPLSAMCPLKPPRVRVSMMAASQAKKSTMAGLLGPFDASKPADTDRSLADRIAQTMEIFRASEAARIIAEPAIDEDRTTLEPDVVVEAGKPDDDNLVTVLKTGKTFDAEELLCSGEKRDDRKVSLFSNTARLAKTKDKPALELELVSQARETMEEALLLESPKPPVIRDEDEDGHQDRRSLHSTFPLTLTPTPTPNPTTTTARPPRIGNAPRSGNKTMTFVARRNN